ncbi:MAG: CocE/NonD family hydrolase [Xanthomonadales bacterium]|nr:CocE/NonD family hydrolase [Xanthomonadales bacterium]
MTRSNSAAKPSWQIEFEQRYAEWEKARNAPPPKLRPPRLEPEIETMVPMRDRAGLFSHVHLPRDEQGSWPAILVRTPYPNPIMPIALGPIEFFRNAGYAVVVQWCRGTWKSEGQFRFFQNEAEDGYDCIEWIAEQDWSDGHIGMYGSSYSASVQWLAARLKPPHLTCIAPQSPGAMFFYETPFLGGTFFKTHFLSWPKLVTSSSLEEIGIDDEFDALDETHPFIQAFRASPNEQVLNDYLGEDAASAMREPLQHPTLDGWWEQIMLTRESAAVIDIPVFAITGFHDGDQAGALYNWSEIEAANPAGHDNRHLLVGPWRHAQMLTGVAEQMGEVSFGENASVALPAAILNFFDVHLKGRGEPTALPDRCRLYTSGSNQWHSTQEYPPRQANKRSMYLCSSGSANSMFGDGQLSAEGPDGPPDRFPADWRFAVPNVSIGSASGANLARHDVLVYTSDPLTEAMTVLGPVRAEIYLAVDAPDADLVLRIEDVWPDGRSVNMTGEMGCAAFRARYRNGFHRETLMTPGEPVRLRFHVCHMGHTFKPGHRIRVVLTATADRLLEPNHHTGEPVLTAVERRTARQTIFHDAERPSRIVLPEFQGDL